MFLSDSGMLDAPLSRISIKKDNFANPHSMPAPRSSPLSTLITLSGFPECSACGPDKVGLQSSSPTSPK